MMWKWATWEIKEVFLIKLFCLKKNCQINCRSWLQIWQGERASSQKNLKWTFSINFKTGKLAFEALMEITSPLDWNFKNIYLLWQERKLLIQYCSCSQMLLVSCHMQITPRWHHIQTARKSQVKMWPNTWICFWKTYQPPLTKLTKFITAKDSHMQLPKEDSSHFHTQWELKTREMPWLLKRNF